MIGSLGGYAEYAELQCLVDVYLDAATTPTEVQVLEMVVITDRYYHHNNNSAAAIAERRANKIAFVNGQFA